MKQLIYVLSSLTTWVVIVLIALHKKRVYKHQHCSAEDSGIQQLWTAKEKNTIYWYVGETKLGIENNAQGIKYRSKTNKPMTRDDVLILQ